jgi:nitrate/nitrite transport system ATP-binding protein
MAFLEIRGVSKSFHQNGQSKSRASRVPGSPPRVIRGLPVLRDINLVIEENEFVCIVGRSGSGKTTLISLIAGLLEPDEGEILLEGKPVHGPGPERALSFRITHCFPIIVLRMFTRRGWVAPRLAEVEKRQRTEHYVTL